MERKARYLVESVWIWSVGCSAGGAEPSSCCHVAASRAPAASVSVQHSPHQDVSLRSLTWEDEKERQMFGVLLISRVCFSLSCAAFGPVWSGVDNPLLSHRLLSLPKRFDYVRNAASPQHAFLFLRGATWFRCAPRRGGDFSDFSFLTSCPDIVRAGCSYRLRRTACQKHLMDL